MMLEQMILHHNTVSNDIVLADNTATVTMYFILFTTYNLRKQYLIYQDDNWSVNCFHNSMSNGSTVMKSVNI